MNRFIARQPILEPDQSLFGYEILSRSGPENYFRLAGNPAATVSAIDELLVTGLSQMTAGLPAFLNCNREFLVRGYLELLPRQSVVGEILETVQPDEEVLASCRRLTRQGYRLALDDYDGTPGMEPFFDLVDFVKIDFMLTGAADQRRMARSFKNLGKRLIAEKVETVDVFKFALDAGYDYFQGYFFCRPETFSRKEVPPNRVTYLRVLQAISQSHTDLDDLARLIKQEPSLSFRLLRYLNSPVFPVVAEISSIPHALSLLGEESSRKWLAVVCVASMSEDKPGELVKLSLLRARFCELLAESSGQAAAKNESFLLGLLSVMDALLDLSMEDVLERVPVDVRIKSALMGQPGELHTILEIVRQYELGNWQSLAVSARSLSLDENMVPAMYLQAVEWADQIVSGVPSSVRS